jgi:protein-S-isoprenylcysteine O-methyltransferase Ste14
LTPKSVEKLTVLPVAPATKEGPMHPETPLRVAFVLLFGLLCAIRVHYHLRARIHEPGVANPAEGRSVWLARAVVLPICLVLASLWLVAPDLVQAAQLPLPAGLRWAGVPVTALGLGLLLWVHRTLDRHFSPFLRIRADHRLVTEGPYRCVRHPMYTAFLILVAGLSLISAYALFFLMGIGMLVAVLWTRTPREEAMMLAHFGDSYRAYMNRTGKLLPPLRCIRRLT